MHYGSYRILIGSLRKRANICAVARIFVSIIFLFCEISSKNILLALYDEKL